MSLIATLEGLHGLSLSEAGRCGCQGGCRLCRHGLSDAQVAAFNARPANRRQRGDVRRAFNEVYRNRAPHAVRDFGLAGLGADVAADVDRPMTKHEKWTVALGVAGLCVSLIGTLTLARRLGRR